MQQPEPRRKIGKRTTAEDRKLFDVTCVVGSVFVSEDGNQSPVAAAFQIIAEHDAPGVFTFPLEGYGTFRVTVEHEREARVIS